MEKIVSECQKLGLTVQNIEQKFANVQGCLSLLRSLSDGSSSKVEADAVQNCVQLLLELFVELTDCELGLGRSQMDCSVDQVKSIDAGPFNWNNEAGEFAYPSLAVDSLGATGSPPEPFEMPCRESTPTPKPATTCNKGLGLISSSAENSIFALPKQPDVSLTNGFVCSIPADIDFDFFSKNQESTSKPVTSKRTSRLLLDETLLDRLDKVLTNTELSPPIFGDTNLPQEFSWKTDSFNEWIVSAEESSSTEAPLCHPLKSELTGGSKKAANNQVDHSRSKTDQYNNRNRLNAAVSVNKKQEVTSLSNGIIKESELIQHSSKPTKKDVASISGCFPVGKVSGNLENVGHITVSNHNRVSASPESIIEMFDPLTPIENNSFYLNDSRVDSEVFTETCDQEVCEILCDEDEFANGPVLLEMTHSQSSQAFPRCSNQSNKSKIPKKPNFDGKFSLITNSNSCNRGFGEESSSDDGSGFDDVANIDDVMAVCGTMNELDISGNSHIDDGSDTILTNDKSLCSDVLLTETSSVSGINLADTSYLTSDGDTSLPPISELCSFDPNDFVLGPNGGDTSQALPVTSLEASPSSDNSDVLARLVANVKTLSRDYDAVRENYFGASPNDSIGLSDCMRQEPLSEYNGIYDNFFVEENNVIDMDSFFRDDANESSSSMCNNGFGAMLTYSTPNTVDLEQRSFHNRISTPSYSDCSTPLTNQIDRDHIGDLLNDIGDINAKLKNCEFDDHMNGAIGSDDQLFQWKPARNRREERLTNDISSFVTSDRCAISSGYAGDTEHIVENQNDCVVHQFAQVNATESKNTINHRGSTDTFESSGNFNGICDDSYLQNNFDASPNKYTNDRDLPGATGAAVMHRDEQMPGRLSSAGNYFDTDVQFGHWPNGSGRDNGLNNELGTRSGSFVERRDNVCRSEDVNDQDDGDDAVEKLAKYFHEEEDDSFHEEVNVARQDSDTRSYRSQRRPTTIDHELEEASTKLQLGLVKDMSLNELLMIGCDGSKSESIDSIRGGRGGHGSRGKSDGGGKKGKQSGVDPYFFWVRWFNAISAKITPEGLSKLANPFLARIWWELPKIGFSRIIRGVNKSLLNRFYSIFIAHTATQLVEMSVEQLTRVLWGMSAVRCDPRPHCPGFVKMWQEAMSRELSQPHGDYPEWCLTGMLYSLYRMRISGLEPYFSKIWLASLTQRICELDSTDLFRGYIAMAYFKLDYGHQRASKAEDAAPPTGEGRDESSIEKGFMGAGAQFWSYLLEVLVGKIPAPTARNTGNYDLKSWRIFLSLIGEVVSLDLRAAPNLKNDLTVIVSAWLRAISTSANKIDTKFSYLLIMKIPLLLNQLTCKEDLIACLPDLVQHNLIHFNSYGLSQVFFEYVKMCRDFRHPPSWPFLLKWFDVAEDVVYHFEDHDLAVALLGCRILSDLGTTNPKPAEDQELEPEFDEDGEFVGHLPRRGLRHSPLQRIPARFFERLISAFSLKLSTVTPRNLSNSLDCIWRVCQRYPITNVEIVNKFFESWLSRCCEVVTFFTVDELAWALDGLGNFVANQSVVDSISNPTKFLAFWLENASSVLRHTSGPDLVRIIGSLGKIGRKFTIHHYDDFGLSWLCAMPGVLEFLTPHQLALCLEGANFLSVHLGGAPEFRRFLGHYCEIVADKCTAMSIADRISILSNFCRISSTTREFTPTVEFVENFLIKATYQMEQNEPGLVDDAWPRILVIVNRMPADTQIGFSQRHLTGNAR